MKTSHKFLLTAFASLALGFVVACGDSNEEPGDDNPLAPQPSTGGGTGSGGGDGSGGGGNDGTGGDIFVPPDREDCPDEPDGEQPDSHPASHRGTPCWNVEECNIVKPEQAKNQCTNSVCVPFDNEGRIEGFDPSKPLPPL